MLQNRHKHLLISTLVTDLTRYSLIKRDRVVRVPVCQTKSKQEQNVLDRNAFLGQ